MRPTTLREKVDSISHELMNDDALFSSVLDRFIEKNAAASTPAEVLRIAAKVEKEAGLSKEAALHTAWETYVRYVNPDFLKEGGKMPPQFMKKDKKDEDKDEEKDEEKGKGKKDKKSGKDDKKSEKDEEKGDEKEEEKFPFKSAAAIELAEKLGMKVKAEIVKEAPKAKMECKTAVARDLAKALGV